MAIDIEEEPTFPPLFTGHSLDVELDPLIWTKEQVQGGKLGAGDFVWSNDLNNLRFTLVLEPEVDHAKCAEILFVTMVGFGDAVGALVLPENSVTYRWPNQILLNDARIGSTDLLISNNLVNDIPSWLIVSLTARIFPDPKAGEPGENPDYTTFWDEGCGELTRNSLLESISRHVLACIHNWSEDGFKSVHEQYCGRFCRIQKLVSELNVIEEFVGLDESGNAILKNGESKLLYTTDALNQLRQQ